MDIEDDLLSEISLGDSSHLPQNDFVQERAHLINLPQNFFISIAQPLTITTNNSSPYTVIFLANFLPELPIK